MKLKKTLVSLLRKIGIMKKSKQELEIDARVYRRQAERSTNEMQRKINNLKKEAVALELSGNHAKALAKATQAKKMQETCDTNNKYITAIDDNMEMQKTVQTILNTQKVITKLGQTVLDQDMTKTLVETVAQSEATMASVKESQEKMNAFMEGISDATDESTLDKAAAEATLQEIMQGMNAEAVREEVAAALPRQEEPLPQWAVEQRNTLKQIAAD